MSATSPRSTSPRASGNGIWKTVGSVPPAIWAANVATSHSYSDGSTSMSGLAASNSSTRVRNASRVSSSVAGGRLLTVSTTCSPEALPLGRRRGRSSPPARRSPRWRRCRSPRRHRRRRTPPRRGRRPGPPPSSARGAAAGRRVLFIAVAAPCLVGVGEFSVAGVDPRGGVRREAAVDRVGAGDQHRPLPWQVDGAGRRLTTHTTSPRRNASTSAGAASHCRSAPASARWIAAGAQRLAVQLEGRAAAAVLRGRRELGPVGRLRQPRLGAGPAGAEAERRLACPTTAAAPGSRRGRGRRRRTGSASGPGCARPGGPRPRGGRARRPGTGRSCPGRAIASSAAARARREAERRGRSGCPCAWHRTRTTCPRGRSASPTRVTSWLESTHVGGAPTGAWASRVATMLRRSASASHGQARKSKLNAVCSSSGRRYRANRSRSGQPQLADQDPRRVVARRRAPATRGTASCSSSRSSNGCPPGPCVGVDLGQVGMLHRQRRRVDAHAGRPAVEPEAQHVLVLTADVRVLPVQVGLAR